MQIPDKIEEEINVLTKEEIDKILTSSLVVSKALDTSFDRIISKIVSFFFTIAFILALVTGISYLSGTDSTDTSFFNRSNLQIKVDNLTGCHYLNSARGGVIPRVNKDGKHICTGEER